MPIPEPGADEFFASSGGVCVYVNVYGRAFRVQFETADSPGVVRGESESGAAQAVAAARATLVKHREALEPLFRKIAEASRP